MKKIIFTILICIFMIPTFVSADTYNMSNTDVTVVLDDTWHVITRDNLENNKSLEELNVSYEYMLDFFNSNETVYMDALKNYDGKYIELFIFKERVIDVTNLSLYNEEELKDFSKEVSNTRKCETYGVELIESKQDKETIAYVKCSRKVDSKFLVEYITVINNDLYLFQFNKENLYSDSDISMIKDIIENAYYNVKKRTEEEDPIIKSVGGKSSDIVKNALIGALIGGIVGGVSGFTFYTLKKKQMDKNNKDNNE